MKTFHKNPEVGEIGIFWLWGNQLIQNSIPWHDSTWLDINGQQVYDFPVDHYRYWKLIQKHIPGLVELEYDEIPRGRIIYNKTTRTFHVYGPKALIKTRRIQRLIKNGFSLSGKKTVFTADPHY